jgi:hypothetical protein
MNEEERKLRAQLGAEISWANTADRTARTAPGSRAAEARFEKEARERHPDASEEQIAQVAEHLRKAHFRRMGLASATKRRRAREQQADTAA